MQNKNLKTEKLENYKKMIVKWQEFKEHAPEYFEKNPGQDLNGKNLEEWKEEADRQLNLLKKHIKKEHTSKIMRGAIPVVIVLLALSVILLPTKSMTGFVIKGLSTTNPGYTDQVNIYYSSSNDYFWMPAHRGAISSVSVTGEVIGGGSAKAYLADGNKTYKLMDSNSIGKNIGDFFQKMFRKKYDTSSSKGMTTRLEYNPGTLYDKDDDGIETQGNIIDFTVSNSTFDIDKKENGLCTMWNVKNIGTEKLLSECYGASMCCISLNLSSSSQKWNETYYVNKLKGITGDNNIVMAQTYYIEKNSGNAITYSSGWAELPATFANETAVFFTNECRQTCNINLNSSTGTYLLRFNASDARIRISNITYTGPAR